MGRIASLTGQKTLGRCAATSACSERAGQAGCSNKNTMVGRLSAVRRIICKGCGLRPMLSFVGLPMRRWPNYGNIGMRGAAINGSLNADKT